MKRYHAFANDIKFYLVSVTQLLSLEAIDFDFSSYSKLIFWLEEMCKLDHHTEVHSFYTNGERANSVELHHSFTLLFLHKNFCRLFGVLYEVRWMLLKQCQLNDLPSAMSVRLSSQSVSSVDNRLFLLARRCLSRLRRNFPPFIFLSRLEVAPSIAP